MIKVIKVGGFLSSVCNPISSLSPWMYGEASTLYFKALTWILSSWWWIKSWDGDNLRAPLHWLGVRMIRGLWSFPRDTRHPEVLLSQSHVWILSEPPPCPVNTLPKEELEHMKSTALGLNHMSKWSNSQTLLRNSALSHLLTEMVLRRL